MAADRTDWLVKYEPWLKLLARLEIDSRFQGKFSASDAVQQTLLEAWRGWDAFRGTADAAGPREELPFDQPRPAPDNDEPQRRAWLRQILAHQLAHLARHYAGTQKRDIAREVSLDQSLAQSSSRLQRMLAADISTPSQQAMAHERELQLAAILDRLPSDYREVIVLRNLRELPHSEVARRMNRTEAAVRQLWLRALTRLRDEVRSIE